MRFLSWSITLPSYNFLSMLLFLSASIFSLSFCLIWPLNSRTCSLRDLIMFSLSLSFSSPLLSQFSWIYLSDSTSNDFFLLTLNRKLLIKWSKPEIINDWLKSRAYLEVVWIDRHFFFISFSCLASSLFITNSLISKGTESYLKIYAAALHTHIS